jgi:hypothetical protein
MLQYELLPRCEGIRLIGDENTLKQLHEVISEVNEKSVTIRNKEGFFLGLAYDLRKAYEGQRKIYPAQQEGRSEKGARTRVATRYGVGILWPTILVQSRQLRDGLGFMDSNKLHQAVTFELEWVLESAIRAQFRQSASEVETLWYRMSTDHAYVEENAETRAAQFASWTAAERSKGIRIILQSLDPMYPFFYKMAAEHGDHTLISPEEYDLWRDRDFPNEGLSVD